MDSKQLEALLEKYWNCETSLEEEKQLKDYFAQGEVAEPLREAAPLFRYLHEQKSKHITDVVFDKQVSDQLRKKPRGKVVWWTFNAARMAAGIAVVIVAGYFVRQEIRASYPEEVTDTYSDPKLAFEETKKALLMISKGFNRGQKETSKIKLFNQAEEKIQGKDKKEEATI